MWAMVPSATGSTDTLMRRPRKVAPVAISLASTAPGAAGVGVWVGVGETVAGLAVGALPPRPTAHQEEGRLRAQSAPSPAQSATERSSAVRSGRSRDRERLAWYRAWLRP